MKILITSDGRFILAGANGFMLAQPSTTSGGGEELPPPVLTETLVLRNFYTTNSTAAPVVQRKAGQLHGDVPVLYDFTGGAPTIPQARVVKVGTGVVVKDWTTLVDISVDGLTGLGTLQGVPQGCDYLLQLRDGYQPNKPETISNGTVRWGVGVCILFMGQSNMIGTMAAGSYASIVPDTSQTEDAYWNGGNVKGAPFGSYGFHKPSSSNGTGSGITSISGGVFAAMRILSKALEVKYGYAVPVAVIPWAFDNHAIYRFLPGGDRYSGLYNIGTAPGGIGLNSPGNYYAGDYEGIAWHQGEADASSSRSVYFDKLKQLYQASLNYVQPFGRTAQDLFFLPAILGVYGSSTYGSIENLRGAVLDLDAYARANNWPRVRAGWNCIDLDPADPNDGVADTLHFQNVPGGNQYRSWSHRRMIQSILYQLGCSTYSGMGPKLSPSATRVGNIATVTIVHEAGTTISTRGDVPLTGWYANTLANFTGTDIAVTAVVSSANTVDVTFPSGTTFPVYLKYMGGRLGDVSSYHPDLSGALYDNVAYPNGTTGTDQFVGLPLVPSVDAITIN